MSKAYVIGPQPLPKSEEIVVFNNLTVGGNTYITGTLYVSGIDVLQCIQSLNSDIDGGSASTYFERADNYINGGTALNG
jgi:hypothetical protein